MKLLEEEIKCVRTLSNNIFDDICSNKPYSQKKYLHIHEKNIKYVNRYFNNCKYKNGNNLFSNDLNIYNVCIDGSSVDKISNNIQYRSCILF
jgi:hypothetical protein